MSKRVSLNPNVAESVIRQLSNYTELLEKTLKSNVDMIGDLESRTNMLEGFVRDYEKQATELKQTIEARDSQIERLNKIIDEMGVIKSEQAEPEPRGVSVRKTYKRRTL